MTYISYVFSRHRGQYERLRSLGLDDEDIDHECIVEVLKHRHKYDATRHPSQSGYDLTFSVRRALYSLLRKQRIKTYPIDRDHAYHDDGTYSDAIESLPQDEQDVIAKHLRGDTLTPAERVTFRNSEKRLKEILGVK